MKYRNLWNSTFKIMNQPALCLELRTIDINRCNNIISLLGEAILIRTIECTFKNRSYSWQDWNEPLTLLQITPVLEKYILLGLHEAQTMLSILTFFPSLVSNPKKEYILSLGANFLDRAPSFLPTLISARELFRNKLNRSSPN